MNTPKTLAQVAAAIAQSISYATKIPLGREALLEIEQIIANYCQSQQVSGAQLGTMNSKDWDSSGNYIGRQPPYGFDAHGASVPQDEGWRVLTEGEVIAFGDQAFDIYAGWSATDNYHAKNKHHADSKGRWTAWRRKAPQQPLPVSGETPITKALTGTFYIADHEVCPECGTKHQRMKSVAVEDCERIELLLATERSAREKQFQEFQETLFDRQNNEMKMVEELGAQIEAAEARAGDVAKALGAYPDSDLVSLATTLEAIRCKAEVVFPAAQKLVEAVTRIHIGPEASDDCDVCRATTALSTALASVPAEMEETVSERLFNAAVKVGETWAKQSGRIWEQMGDQNPRVEAVELAVNLLTNEVAFAQDSRKVPAERTDVNQDTKRTGGVVEYDGAFFCTLCGANWGAISHPDKPCEHSGERNHDSK